MSRLRSVLAALYLAVGLLILVGMISHSAWYFAHFEHAGSDGYGLIIAVGLEAAIAINAGAQIALRLRGEDVPIALARLMYVLLAVSFATQFVHADGNNQLDGAGAGHYISALLASLPLPASLFAYVEIAVALLARPNVAAVAHPLQVATQPTVATLPPLIVARPLPLQRPTLQVAAATESHATRRVTAKVATQMQQQRNDNATPMQRPLTSTERSRLARQRKAADATLQGEENNNG